MTDETSEPEGVEPSESVAEPKAKPARKPRAAKPKVEAAADAPVAEVDAEAKVEKPKRARAAKAKAADEGTPDETAVVESEGAVLAVPSPAPEDSAPAPKPKASRSKQPEPKQPEPKKAPKRERQEPHAAPVVRAQAKYVRSSARKARLVCDNIRGKSVEDARAILAHTPRAVARDWSKLLESAVANAENNHDLDGEDLVIKAVHADEGPTIKRFRPRAMGRATQIRKRTSHLTILLTPKN